jgi:hypothetical protein
VQSEYRSSTSTKDIILKFEILKFPNNSEILTVNNIIIS